jgi:hypothetical protein
MNAGVKGASRIDERSDAESEWGDLTAGLISLLGEPRLNAIAARLDATVLPTSQQCAANHLRAALQLATSETRRICVSIDRLASTLQWRQNPNYAGADFLDSYAYCELVGPHGHLQHAQVALGLLLLGPRVTYPEHAHPATETYGVIAGHAEWLQGDGSGAGVCPANSFATRRWSRTRCARPTSRCSRRTFGRIISTTMRGCERSEPANEGRRASMTDVADLINLARYPITEPASAVLAKRVATLRTSLQETGAAEAPAFLSARGLERCIADAESLAPQQYKSVGAGTAYLEDPDPKWSKDHPRAIRQRYSVGVVAYDQFPAAVAGAVSVRVAPGDRVRQRGARARTAVSICGSDGRAESRGDGRRRRTAVGTTTRRTSSCRLRCATPTLAATSKWRRNCVAPLTRTIPAFRACWPAVPTASGACR